ncbi:hypothetical protein [uncultured Nitrospira sp.]|uniref:hypothetical protein n=1 Tax=uncultured Nitrospira sp. TaxID=157176 RepID=UPI00313FEC3C
MNKKIFISFFLVGMLLSLPQFVLASESSQEQNSSWKLETQGWSIQDHMAAAKDKEGEAQSLQSRVRHLGERIAHFEKKPHFDPKGIHRNSMKLIASTLTGELNRLNKEIAWHFRQADHAKLME